MFTLIDFDSTLRSLVVLYSGREPCLVGFMSSVGQIDLVPSIFTVSLLQSFAIREAEMPPEF